MHLALLRGINVGGKKVIRMRELKLAFEEIGLRDVRTYIQSGNVLFRSVDRSAGRITVKIEDALSAKLGSPVRAVVKSKRQYQNALTYAPPSWGQSPTWQHNAIFAKAGSRTTAILDELPPLRDELEEATCGPGVIFWSASREGISRTTMMKVSRLPVYQDLTVRNHTTTLALLNLLLESTR